MSDPRSELGQAGERLAEQFLKRLGYKLIARRFSTPVGELDLVMRDRATVVIIEVKTRADRRLADPQDAVRAGKQEKLRRCATWFLNHKRWTNDAVRFDVVAIVMAAERPPEIEHFIDAF